MKNKIKNKKMKKMATTIIIEATILFLIIGSLLFLTPKITNVGEQDKITFFKFTNAYAVLVDDNPEFSSPQKIEERAVKLNPGEYYWKAVGILGESEMGNFTIDSEVVINMNINKDVTTIDNEGNTPVNLTKRTGSIISGNMIIDVNDEQEFENGDNLSFEARQK